MNKSDNFTMFWFSLSSKLLTNRLTFHSTVKVWFHKFWWKKEILTNQWSLIFCMSSVRVKYSERTIWYKTSDFLKTFSTYSLQRGSTQLFRIIIKKKNLFSDEGLEGTEYRLSSSILSTWKLRLKWISLKNNFIYKGTNNSLINKYYNFCRNLQPRDGWYRG